MNRCVNIQEDIKRYQETLSYASSKVDYSVGENLFMLPSNMQLKIRSGTVGYNNKILVFDFNLGKNDEVNSSKATAIKKSHNASSIEPTTITHAPATSQKNQKPITHIRKRLVWYWLWQVVLQYGIRSDESSRNVYYFCEDLTRFQIILLYGSPTELV